MKREIKTHQVNGLNEQLRILVLDDPGSGNACHRYQIAPVEKMSERDPVKASQLARAHCDVNFQNGPINENGVNGISNEALLAIVRDRLEGFQSGEFACLENEMALRHVNQAMDVLHSRTKERLERGVEGTHTV